MSGFQSPLAPYITGLIAQKKACGYAYVYQEHVLEPFARFSIEQTHEVNTITRDLGMEWAIQRSTEGKNHRNQQVSFVRPLALYMLSLGMNVYVPWHYASETVPAPYILSMRELSEFFAAVDSFELPQPSLRRLAPIFRILFRLYYCCGLRLVEACRLRRSCFDLKEGLISILHSKGDKDRLGPLSADVQSMCSDYDAMMQWIVPDREWFFPGISPDRPFEKTSIDRKFCQLWTLTPSSAAVDRQPTIQCLRHTFVVNKVNEWMDAGLDLSAMMPYLSRYLGHASIERRSTLPRPGLPHRATTLSPSTSFRRWTPMRNEHRTGTLFFSMTQEFLETYLPRQCGRSSQTVESYRDALSLFRRYIVGVLGIPMGSFTFATCNRG